MMVDKAIHVNLVLYNYRPAEYSEIKRTRQNVFTTRGRHCLATLQGAGTAEFYAENIRHARR